LCSITECSSGWTAQPGRGVHDHGHVGQPQRSAHQVRRVGSEPVDQHAPGQSRQALGRETVGDHQGALATLAEALTLGAPEGYVRVFVDKGHAMAAVLRHLVAGRRKQLAAADTLSREYLTRLLAAFERAGHRSSHPLGTAQWWFQGWSTC
jgi:hypothetical protein